MNDVDKFYAVQKVVELVAKLGLNVKQERARLYQGSG